MVLNNCVPTAPSGPILALLGAASSPLRMNGLHYSDGENLLSAMLLKCNAGSVGLSLHGRFVAYVKGSTVFS